MTATIEIVDTPTDEVVTALARLLPQLSSATPPTASELAAIIADGQTFFVACVDGVIVGCLTLVLYRIPTGLKAWIEDVVVDEAARGSGVGEALNLAAIDEARRRGANAVNLTSRRSQKPPTASTNGWASRPATPPCTATTCSGELRQG